MDEARLRRLLEAVASGAESPTGALRQLKGFAIEDLGRIQLDHHRQLRTGYPEVIYAPGKDPDDLRRILAAQLEHRGPVLVTRIEEAVATAFLAAHAELAYDPEARMLYSQNGWPEATGVRVAVLAAGTADLPVASEAARVAQLGGCTVETCWDCGVAGVHRLTAQQALLERADLLIVVAGMEGALPSVVGGLVGKPLIAVPTSVGYGTGLGGYAALLTMLNSCAAGTVVVNIDNGFGAGFFAGLLARQMRDRTPGSAG